MVQIAIKSDTEIQAHLPKIRVERAKQRKESTKIQIQQRNDDKDLILASTNLEIQALCRLLGTKTETKLTLVQQATTNEAKLIMQHAAIAQERRQAAIALLKQRAEHDPVIEAMLVVLNLA